MIERLRICSGTSFDPHYNLAVEQVLLEQVQEGELILYLWQNRNTVVIGKNQNAWKECRTTMLEQEGGRLARRLSGGGAVFHDLGNLNFTFLVRTEDYSVDRQLSVILEAVKSYGIKAEKSGRNDVLALGRADGEAQAEETGDLPAGPGPRTAGAAKPAGRKFSGNAFYSSRGHAYHHGTLLVDVDMEKLGRYLNPSKAKLAGKGVDSARARVVNLKELAPGMTIDGLRRAMEEAAARVYGLAPQPYEWDDDGGEAACKIQKYFERNRSYDWLYGRKMAFTLSCEERFAWGGLELAFQVDEGRVTGCAVYTDSMDHELAEKLQKAFAGCRLSTQVLCAAVRGAGLAQDVSDDVCAMIARQEL